MDGKVDVIRHPDARNPRHSDESKHRGFRYWRELWFRLVRDRPFRRVPDPALFLPCRAALRLGCPGHEHGYGQSPRNRLTSSELLVKCPAKSVLFAGDALGRTGRLAADVEYQNITAEAPRQASR